MKPEHRWFYKQAVSFYLDAGRPLPRGVRREVERDPECRAFYHDQMTVVREIERSVEDCCDQVPGSLESAILLRLDADEEPTDANVSAPAWERSLRSVHPLAGAAAMIFLLIGIGPIMDERPSGASSRAYVEAESISVDGLPALGNLSRWAMSLENPLEKEMSATLSSAAQAVETFREEYFPESILKTFGSAANSIRPMERSHGDEP